MHQIEPEEIIHMDTRSSLPTLLSGAKLCVYCGREADTVDHTPSRCLLRKPLPSNLITLPACQKCNNAFSFEESVVRGFLTSVGSDPELVAERQAGGRLDRALRRDARLREVLNQSLQPNRNFHPDREVLTAFQRVFQKAAQGLFFGMYQRLVPAEQVRLIRVIDRRAVSPEQVIAELRPNPLVDITDQPLSEISPNSWHVREPIFIMEMVPAQGGEPERRAFRLKRDTDVEWIPFQPKVLEFAFVKHEEEGMACVLELWQTLIVAVSAPWPDDRGPLRRGRKNPFSREAPKDSVI
jgi:hypothetical protein